VFDFAQTATVENISLQSITLRSEATVEWEQWAVEDSDSDTRAVGDSWTL